MDKGSISSEYPASAIFCSLSSKGGQRPPEVRSVPLPLRVVDKTKNDRKGRFSFDRGDTSRFSALDGRRSSAVADVHRKSALYRFPSKSKILTLDHCIPPEAVSCQLGDLSLDFVKHFNLQKVLSRVANSEAVALPTELEVHIVLNTFCRALHDGLVVQKCNSQFYDFVICSIVNCTHSVIFTVPTPKMEV